jgi:small-conductance mechanosensitive channel
VETAPKIVGTLVYWSVFLFFAAAAMEQLPIPIVTDSLHSIAFYIPKVLLGVVVVFLGVGIGSLANQWIAGAAGSAGVANSAGLGRVAQVSILVAALIVGLEQVGLESSLFTAIIAIVIAAILGGLALAFGLGSGPMVSNIMGSYHAAKAYRIGDFVRIAGYEGTVREINPASIVLDSPDGEVHVPAKTFGDQVSIVQRGRE